MDEMGTETLGLRERKRIATRQLIEHTAVELVLDLGYDEVTVEKICEACNLSTRTFFNYFPTKDAAIGGLMLVVPSETTMLTLIGEHPDDPLRGALPDGADAERDVDRLAADHVRIPRSSRSSFRFDPGHHSEKFPATLVGVRSLIVGAIFSAE